ncbi:hypothetical protein M501DRAFT_485677 [Patellaria atrata CBS 101060]|uniref:DNA repair protein rad9 n=1 Tax=Patellaria atrata CBS 101060 TaxID=1346257 RepID=A0A9P4S4K7_9PEZI|nr:hypothetical protein M501DRAFT_485677 [Patellaria atrata CBS 101060]
MVTLNFTLTPGAASRIHDLLLCLSKFSESVQIEARKERLALTALNSSKSAYASFSLLVPDFFSKYEFSSENYNTDGKFTCSILNKALLSVFKGRGFDARGRDTGVDQCEVNVQDRDGQAQCRMIIKMVCNQGVTKTYKLTYESIEIMHALFDKTIAPNSWAISSGALRRFIDYFAVKTEQLDIYSDDNKVHFSAFTEKIMNGKDILKQPLHTSVIANVNEFNRFTAEERRHHIISVRDFRAIVTHADTLRATVSAYYSDPGRPLQFSYNSNGMVCEFTLMTSSDYRGTLTPAPTGPPSRATSATTSAPLDPKQSTAQMPPPAVPARRSRNRNRAPGSSVRPARQSPDPESLFVPDDDEGVWQPVENRGEEDLLGWDASADNDVAFHPTFRDTGSLSHSETLGSEEGIAPTQRLSQIQGALFD